MSTLERSGDTELWVIAGENWKLPVLADPYGQHYRLRPPMDATMTVEMLKALDDRLNQFKLPAQSSYVIIRNEDLHKVGTKAPGITPAYYIDWQGQEKEINREVEQLLVDPPDTDEGKDFCVYLHRLTGLVEYPTLRLIWRAICQYGPRFLIEERKPIDMGFVRLVPLPFRANWKQIMAAKFPLSPSWAMDSAPRRRIFMEVSGFFAEMFNSVLAAFNRERGYCYWTLEAVTTPAWWNYTGAHEGRKISKLGPVRYAEFWRSGIKKMFPHAIGAFREWCRWNRLPCAELDDGLVFGGRRLVVHVDRKKVRPLPPPDGPTRVVVDADPTILKGPKDGQPLPRKNRDMPKMPDFLPEPRYVRLLTGGNGEDEGPDLEKSSNGGA